MTDRTVPAEIDAAIDNRSVAHALSKAGGHNGYVVQGADISRFYSALDDSAINSFANLGTNGLDLTIDAGEAFVGGWLCRDRSTTISLPASSTSIVVVGIDLDAQLGSTESSNDNDNVFVDIEANVSEANPYVQLYEVTTTSSSISSVDDIRPSGPRGVTSDSFATVTEHESLKNDYDSFRSSGGSVGGTLDVSGSVLIDGDIGMGNDASVISYNDQNDESGPHWSGVDGIDLKGDGSVSEVVLNVGHINSLGGGAVGGSLDVGGNLTAEGGELIVGTPSDIRGALRARYLGGSHGGTSTYLRDGDGTEVVRLRNGRVAIGANPSQPASGYAGHIQGDAQVDGALDVGGETTTDRATFSRSDGQVTSLPGIVSSGEAGLYVGPWSDDGTDTSVTVELGTEDYALATRSPSIGYGAVPSFVFRREGGFDVWNEGTSQIFSVDSGGNTEAGGDLTVQGPQISIPNADGNDGVQLASGAAYSVYNDWATVYSYSGDGGVGFRVRNPDDSGDKFTVDNTTGDGWFDGKIVQDGNDVVDSPDGQYEIQVNGTDGDGIINFKT